MTLVALRCPHCGGTVNMEDDLASGFCTFCGNRVINDRVAANRAQAEAERRHNVTSLLRMAKHHLEDGDTHQAESLLKSAMMLDSANSDCDIPLLWRAAFRFVSFLPARQMSMTFSTMACTSRSW